MKVALILIVVTVVGSSVAWVVNVVQDREQLSIELAVQRDANLVQVASMVKMAKDKKLIEKQVIERNKANRAQKIKLRKLRNQLNEEAKKFTAAEKQCLNSDIPPAIVNFLRRKGTISTEN